MPLLHDILVFIGIRKAAPVRSRLAAMEARDRSPLSQALRKARQDNAKAMRNHDEARRRKEAGRRHAETVAHDETTPSVHLRWSDDGRGAGRTEVDIPIAQQPSFASGGGGDFGGAGASGSWSTQATAIDSDASTSSCDTGSSSSESASSSTSD